MNNKKLLAMALMIMGSANAMENTDSVGVTQRGVLSLRGGMRQTDEDEYSMSSLDREHMANKKSQPSKQQKVLQDLREHMANKKSQPSKLMGSANAMENTDSGYLEKMKQSNNRTLGGTQRGVLSLRGGMRQTDEDEYSMSSLDREHMANKKSQPSKQQKVLQDLREHMANKKNRSNQELQRGEDQLLTQNNQLMEQREDAEEQNINLEEQLEELNKEMAEQLEELNNEMAREKYNNNQLLTQNNQLMGQNRNLEKQLKDAEGQNNQLLRQNINLEKQLEDAKGQNNQLMKQLEDAKGQNIKSKKVPESSSDA
jgi:molybdopterin converting factor small subunit